MKQTVAQVVAEFEALDPESALIREVYAHFGLAIFQANRLERTLADAIFITESLKVRETVSSKAAYYAITEKIDSNLAKLTMGRLVERFEKQADLEVLNLLKDALIKRNHLAHHYFWERAGEFVIAPEGQLKMIAECDHARDLFMQCESLISRKNSNFHGLFGLNAARLSALENDLIQRARKSLNI